MLGREEQRLRRTFGALLLALVPAAAHSACSEGASENVAPDAAEASTSLDATVDDAAPEEASTNDATAGNDAPDAFDAGEAEAQSCGAIVNVIPPGPDAAPDADPGCAIDLPCGLPERIFAIGCELYHLEPDDAAPTDIYCRMIEDAGCKNDAASFVDGGFISTVCLDCPGGAGRATAGIPSPDRVRARTVAGAWFARMAHGEAASVFAFERLARELATHRAPRALVRAARRAARDEVSHAQTMRRFAHERGARVPVVDATRAVRSRARSLATLAAENAAEGCVRETFGALILAHQARVAGTAALRDAFARIAADETRHAALAWTLAHWAEQRLDPLERRRVRGAQRRAVRALRSEIDAEKPRQRDPIVGLPDRATATALLDGLAAALEWPA